MLERLHKRYIILIIITFVAFVILFFGLFDLQIRNGQYYYEQSQTNKRKEIIIKGSRGKIFDSNYIPLAYDEKSYDIEFYRLTSGGTSKRHEYTQIIYRTIQIIEKNGGKTLDTFYLRKDDKGEFAFQWNDLSEEANEKKEKLFRENMYVGSKRTAEEIFLYLLEYYGIDDTISYEDSLKILSVWQEVQYTYFLGYVPVKLARNVDIETVAQIEARSMDLEGISVAEGTSRVYPHGDVAAHIIGYTGRINSESQIDKYVKEKNYSLEDLIGISGIESSQEDYLTGNSEEHQGKRIVEVNRSGRIVRELENTEASDGNNVMLTIDFKMQRRLEEALRQNIEEVRKVQLEKYEENKEAYQEVEEKRNEPVRYADMGAAVVLDVNTGEVLAMTSYPSYDLNLFVGGVDSDAYKALSTDKSSPMLNKVIGSRGTPGSVFKMVTGLAGLMNQRITLTERIDDAGPYDRFIKSGKAPKCWTSNPSQHAQEDIVNALKDSCNYYFYEVAYRLTIDGLLEWSQKLGLTEKTGIELPGELSGIVANQKVLFDPEKDISQQRSSYFVMSIYKRIKERVVKVGQEMGAEYQEEALEKAIGDIMRQFVLDTNEPAQPGPYIRQILYDQLHIPAAITRQYLLDQEISIDLLDIKWNPNQTILTGIGQNVTTLTPIAMARYVATIVNGGRLMETHVVKQILSPDGEVIEDIQPKLIQDLSLPAEYVSSIKEGMAKVVNPEDHGTAQRYFDQYKYLDKIGGKTGTAQVYDNMDLENNAWFVAFAPFDKPEIAVVIYIPHGYSGGLASIAARDIITYYLDRKYQMPQNDMPKYGNLVQ